VVFDAFEAKANFEGIRARARTLDALNLKARAEN